MSLNNYITFINGCRRPTINVWNYACWQASFDFQLIWTHHLPIQLYTLVINELTGVPWVTDNLNLGIAVIKLRCQRIEF